MEGQATYENDGFTGIPKAVLLQGNLSKQLIKDNAEGKEIDPDKIETVKDGEQDVKPESFKADQASELATDDDVIEDNLDKPVETADQKRAEALEKQKLQREKTLQGMFDKYKVQAQERENKLLDQIDRLNATVSNLNETIKSLRSKPVVTDDGLDDDFIDDDDLDDPGKRVKLRKVDKIDPMAFKDYGQDIVDLAQTVNDLKEENARLRQDTDSFVETASTIQRSTVRDQISTFEGEMAQKVHKSWKAINGDALFIQWLQENPDMQEAVNIAGRSLNSTSAARIFNMFIRETGYIVEDTPEYNIDDEIIPDLNGSGEEIEGDTRKGQFRKVSRAEYNRAAKRKALGQITDKQFATIEKNFRASVQRGLV